MASGKLTCCSSTSKIAASEVPDPAKFTRNRKIYPNEESALKLVYMAIHEASKKWTKPIRHWKQALNHFAIMFEDRVPDLTSK
jgi:transposase-like protein